MSSKSNSARMKSLPKFQDIVHNDLTSVSFSFYNPEDVRKTSAVEIKFAHRFDALGNTVEHGLYDLRMGAFIGTGPQMQKCHTCHQGYERCPGHLGHIELAAPVFHPLLFRTLLRFMNCACPKCCTFLYPRLSKHLLIATLELLNLGLIAEALDFNNEWESKLKSKALIVESEIENSFKEVVNTAAKSAGQTVPEFIQHNANHVSVNANRVKETVVKAFFADCRGQKACKNCGLHVPKFTQQGMNRLYMTPLDVKSLNANRAKGFDVEKVLRALPLRASQDSTSALVDSADVDEDLVTEGKGKKGKKAPAKKTKSNYSGVEDDDQEAEEDNQRDEEEEDEESLANHEAHANNKKPKYISVYIASAFMHQLFAKDATLCSHLFGSPVIVDGSIVRTASAHRFFLDVLPVQASRFRPPAMLGGLMMESLSDKLLSVVLDCNERLRLAAKSDSPSAIMIIRNLILLQTAVNQVIDSSASPSSSTPSPGIRQILEKKEGLFRKNMMGKRVNYAARTVISPDPYISTAEIGIPLHFAMNLTYPQPVNAHNLDEMRRAVINGPDRYPGAACVVDAEGRFIDLSALSDEARVAEANSLTTGFESVNGVWPRPKIVYRHLKDGDAMLVNRQPTLHKPSIMGHRAKVLCSQKTIRMHYANCNTYNADFDGDEMNVHLVQTEQARAEVYNIMNTDNQYIVPTSGGPIRGLIQDHVAAGSLLTKRDSFFTREQYFHLVYGSVYHMDATVPIQTLPPAIMKPVPMWTGKQVVTTVLNRITHGLTPFNCNFKSKIPGKAWNRYNSTIPGAEDCEDSEVCIRENVLCTGVLDKSAFGASAFGLVHTMYEVYGAEYSGILLTCLGRLFTLYFQYLGFTNGIDDFILLKDAEQDRDSMLLDAEKACYEVSCNFAGFKQNTAQPALSVSLEKILRRDARSGARLDTEVKAKLSKATSGVIARCLPRGQWKPFPENNLALMTISGAKGSAVNFSQIVCLLGQQEFEGRRVKQMISGKTLPQFVRFDGSARAGGYIKNRFLTGIRPPEYFFHCMAGRDGLVDTAVKTARSGYLQRCLIKHMEGLRVHYDHTVRDSDRSILQFNYGEDTLDVVKTKFNEQFSFMALNAEAFRQRVSAEQIVKAFPKATDVSPEIAQYNKPSKSKKAKDPVLSVFSPTRYLGAVSERFSKKLSDYISSRPAEIIAADADPKAPILSKFRIPEQEFRQLAHMKFMRSVADPGESVGLLAAQSIGEPSTQMTLNTFHHAGSDQAHVTMGIPRLRELLLTASVKKTIITIPGREHVTRQDMDRLAMTLTRITLEQVVREINVEEAVRSSGSVSSLEYRVTLKFRSLKSLDSKFNLTWSEVRDACRNLVSLISKAITKETNSRPAVSAMAEGVKEAALYGDTDAEIFDDDEDADARDRRLKKSDHASYDSASAAGKKKDKKKGGDADDVEANDDDDTHSVAESEASGPKAASSAAAEDVDMDDDVGASSKDAKDITFSSEKAAELTASFQFKLSATSQKILLSSLIERILTKIAVRSPPGISRTTVVEAKGGSGKGADLSLSVEGDNLAPLFAIDDMIDINRLSSNDVRLMLRTFGVESARRTEVNDLAAVFDAYGIDVNYRHLSLIGDYQMFDGDYKPFSRNGMRFQTSPLLKMSYETTVKFLMDGVMNGEVDELKSPASCIVVGKVPEFGSGSIDILQSVDYTLPKSKKKLSA